MPVTCIPSSEEDGERQKSTAKKRRRNQNVEIDELSLLLPVARSYGTMMDKISTLRMTTAYLKLNTFLTSVIGGDGEGKSHGNGGASFLQGYSHLLQQAADGFFLILDNNANILYVSETISEHVDLAQQDVLGLSLYEITHEDDMKVIDENLQSSGTKTTQFRQFYIRCKSTLTPGRMQQSRFTGYKMVQIMGHLKLSRQDGGKMAVLGLVAECHLIEATPSILELSIPQTYFTSTIGLDLKIVSVDTKVSKVTGFDPINFIGADIADYFHPLDHAKMTPCRALLLRSGAAVSPLFRFMTSSGDWIWAQLEGLVRYKEGTVQPLYYEVKCKAVSHTDGALKFIEQTQLYASSDAKAYDDPKAFHRDKYFVNRMPSEAVPDDPKPIVSGLMEAKMPPDVVDALLHTRELGLGDLEQRGFKRLAVEDEGSHDLLGGSNSSHGSPHTKGEGMLERAKSFSSMTSDYYSDPSPHSTTSVLQSVGSPDSAFVSYQSPASASFLSPSHTDAAWVPESHSEFSEDCAQVLNWQDNSFRPKENSLQPRKSPFHTSFSCMPSVPYFTGCTAVPPPHAPLTINHHGGSTFAPGAMFVSSQAQSCTSFSNTWEKLPHLEFNKGVVRSNGSKDELNDILEQFI